MKNIIHSEKEKDHESLKKTTDGESLDTADQKTYRKRKRHYFNAIRSQMEFYFGDANLSKDRFLKQLIEKDPFVPLEVFLTFNKMKALTASLEEIVRSLSNSELLELDESQAKVRRKLPLPTERNVDEKTLYVEGLPPNVDHDWVKSKFERFGQVVYVSLPKYAKSRKIKEFGFIEFESESSVLKAINTFKEFNGVLNIEDTDPAELTSVQSYIKENQQSNSQEEEAMVISKLRKTKDEEKPKAKKAKTEDEDDNTTARAAENEEISASETADEPANEEQTDQALTRKKLRKKKHRIKNVEKQQKEAELNADATYYEMKILPKRDWKRLRNKYLNLQREKLSELKRKAWKDRKEAEQQANDNSAEIADTAAPPPAKNSKHSERNLHKMNMNFYGAGCDEPPSKAASAKYVEQNAALERAPLFSYKPGLIVEISFTAPCVNIKEFKSDMRQYPTVKYIDIKEGAMHANLRLDSTVAVDEFVHQINCAEYKCKVLSGEAEGEYWKKIELDREMKLNKQIKLPQKRGREKVKKLVTQHIRFGDNDDEN